MTTSAGTSSDATRAGSASTSSSCSDVTSTYFESGAQANARAKRGYSRDKRPDCKQVNIGLFVTPEGGLSVGYEVFDGNRADVTSVGDMVRLMEEKYGKTRRV